MTRPNIQIDDEVREMTEEEYEALLASGWTEEAQPLLGDRDSRGRGGRSSLSYHSPGLNSAPVIAAAKHAARKPSSEKTRDQSIPDTWAPGPPRSIAKRESVRGSG